MFCLLNSEQISVSLTLIRLDDVDTQTRHPHSDIPINRTEASLLNEQIANIGIHFIDYGPFVNIDFLRS